MKVVKLTYSPGRMLDAVCCPECNGYAHEDVVTQEEDAEYGCGRYRGCCSRAFICKRCGTRILGTAEAPEVSYD